MHEALLWAPTVMSLLPGCNDPCASYAGLWVCTLNNIAGAFRKESKGSPATRSPTQHHHLLVCVGQMGWGVGRRFLLEDDVALQGLRHLSAPRIFLCLVTHTLPGRPIEPLHLPASQSSCPLPCDFRPDLFLLIPPFLHPSCCWWNVAMVKHKCVDRFSHV